MVAFHQIISAVVPERKKKMSTKLKTKSSSAIAGKEKFNLKSRRKSVFLKWNGFRVRTKYDVKLLLL